VQPTFLVRKVGKRTFASGRVYLMRSHLTRGQTRGEAKAPTPRAAPWLSLWESCRAQRDREEKCTRPAEFEGPLRGGPESSPWKGEVAAKPTEGIEDRSLFNAPPSVAFGDSSPQWEEPFALRSLPLLLAPYETEKPKTNPAGTKFFCLLSLRDRRVCSPLRRPPCETREPKTNPARDKSSFLPLFLQEKRGLYLFII